MLWNSGLTRLENHLNERWYSPSGPHLSLQSRSGAAFVDKVFLSKYWTSNSHLIACDAFLKRSLSQESIADHISNPGSIVKEVAHVESAALFSPEHLEGYEIVWVGSYLNFKFYANTLYSSFHNDEAEASQITVGVEIPMHATNLLACWQLEFIHSAIITLALKGGTLAAGCVDSDGLHVVLFPCSHTDRVNLLFAYHQLSWHFCARAKDRRLSSIIEIQFETVDAHTDTRCDLRQISRLILSTTVELVCLTSDNFLDFWKLKVLSSLRTLHCQSSAFDPWSWHWCRQF